MLKLHEEADGQILTLGMSGKLTKEDYQHFLPEVERQITRHGKIRILCRMHDFHGWNLGALWEDIKFDAKHFNHIERVALVGEQRWQHGMAVFCKPFTKAKVRYFDERQSEDAEEWIWVDLPISIPGGTQQRTSSVKHDVVQEASEDSFPASDSPAY